MKIDSVEAIPLRLQSVNDSVDGTQDNLLIRIETDEGVVGYGEVDSSPGVIAAVVEASMSHGISYGLRDILVGRNPLHIAQLWDEMYRKTVYHGRSGPVLHAMSGVEMALWDIAGKIRGEPIHQMLGARYREKVLAYASTLMPDDAGAAQDLAAEFKDLGFRAMKFGWGPIRPKPDTRPRTLRSCTPGCWPECAYHDRRWSGLSPEGRATNSGTVAGWTCTGSRTAQS